MSYVSASLPASGPVVCWDVWDWLAPALISSLGSFFRMIYMDRKYSVISSILKTVKHSLNLLPASKKKNLLFLCSSKSNSSRFVYSDCPHFTLCLFRPPIGAWIQLYSLLLHWNCSWRGCSRHVLFPFSPIWYDLDFLVYELNSG